MRDLDWKILYELYKNPNLTQVAKTIYLTQPTLTKRLKQLEEELETQIVDRAPKGLVLTDEGRYLGQKAGEYLQFREQIDEELRKKKQEKIEYLHIGSAYTFTKYMLRPMLEPFTEQHPTISFRVTNKQSHILHQLLLDGEIDAAFIRGDYIQGVSKVPVRPDFGYLVTRRKVEIERLPEMNRILYQTNEWTEHLLNTWWESWFGKTDYKEGGSAGYVDFALNSILRDDDYVICFLPEEAPEIPGLTVTPIRMKDGTRVLRNTWFIYRNEKRMSRTLEEFVRFIEDECRYR